MNEIWKDVLGYEGYYQISSLGNVKSVRSNKILKTSLDSYGYLHVIFSVNGKQKGYTVHQLVAKHFIDNPNQLEQVNHIDSCKTNNVVSNLEWCTPQENIAHRDIHNPRVNYVKGTHLITNETFIFRNAKLAGEFVNGNNTNVIKVCKGKKSSYKGYKWEYIDK